MQRDVGSQDAVGIHCRECGDGLRFKTKQTVSGEMARPAKAPFASRNVRRALLGGIYKENTMWRKRYPKCTRSAPWYNQIFGCTKAVTLECHS